MSKSKIKPKTFAVDFDGTCVAFDFPRVGKEIGAAEVLKDLVLNGHRIILNTMRSDKANPVSNDPSIIGCGKDVDTNYLSHAVAWFTGHNIPLYGINTNPTQASWTDSPKVYADFYIDDISIGCPLMLDHKLSDRPFVDWVMIRSSLVARNLL